jgi:RNA polymerase primary sigma factor
MIKFESNHLVQSALGFLTEQEQMVITLRFGLKNNKVLTLKEIGERMGISRERVRQIEAHAKGRLRKAFARSRAVSAPPKNIYPNRALGKRNQIKPTI